MDTREFGDIIRTRREQLGLTRKSLCEGICSEFSLLRIENGTQFPSYWTIRTLLERLGLSSQGIQVPISKSDCDVLNLQYQIRSSVTRHKYEETLSTIAELERKIDQKDCFGQQFLLQYQAIAGNMKDGEAVPFEPEAKLNLLLQAIHLTIPQFELDKFAQKWMSIQEVHIIQEIAVTLSEQGQRRESIDLLYQLLKYEQNHHGLLEKEAEMMPLITHDLSKLLQLEGRYKESLEISEMGLQYYLNYDNSLLPELLVNQAYCLHEVGPMEEAVKKLYQAYYGLKSMEHDVNLKLLIEYAKNTFHIDFKE